MGWFGAGTLVHAAAHIPRHTGISLLERVSITAGAEGGKLSILSALYYHSFSTL